MRGAARKGGPYREGTGYFVSTVGLDEEVVRRYAAHASIIRCRLTFITVKICP